MEEEEFEPQGSENTDEGADLGADSRDDWDVETYQEKFAELEAKNKQLYARMKKAETKETKPEPVQAKAPAKAQTKDDLRRELAEIKLKQAHPDLGYEDIQRAMRFAEVDGQDVGEVIQSDFFQSYVKSKVEKAQQAQATPSPSNRSNSTTTDYDKILEDPELIRELAENNPKQYAKFREWLERKEGKTTLRPTRSL